MRYLSLFSGIEAASVAFTPLGWECVGVAEIEPFPCKVLAHYYPNVPNLGSVTDITKEQIEALGHIDLVIFGAPCQDLSIAGKRKGMRNDDGTATRSGLFFTATKICEWSGARFALYENVPGMFSSNHGGDFASVVGEMAGCEFDIPRGGWTNAGCAVGKHGLVEWVTLDAQYCRTSLYPRAVPQRRRRVFVIRDSGDWNSRPPLFLIKESMSGNPPPSRKTREEVAGTVRESIEGGVSKCLTKGIAQRYDFETETMIPTYALSGNTIAFHVDAQPDEMNFSTETTATLTKSQHAGCMQPNMKVRRLTPLECHRLQGFPDNYLNQVNGSSDTVMYRGIGNSMAVNVMNLIGRRIQMVNNIK